MANNIVSISIYINGVLLDDANSVVYKVSIEESISNEFPKLEMHLGLRDVFLTDYPVTDGSVIRIELRKDNDVKVCNFRMFHYQAMSSPLGGTLEYQIVAYHEALWYLSKIEDEAYNMTSECAFHRIADKTNLDFDSDQTNDAMAWFTVEGNRLNFMREMCLHAWANKFSVYAWWVSKTGVLNFKNIIERVQQKSKYVFAESLDILNELKTGVQPVTNVTYTVESAVNNFRFGYGNNLTFFDTDNVKNRILYPREFQTNVQSLNIAKVGQNQSWIASGLSSENVHANYKRAEVQNKRGLALWSTVITCVDQYCIDVDIGDCIEFLFKLDGKEDCMLYSGNYLVSGINFLIDSQDTPVQQITLVRQGISVPVFDATSSEQPFSNSQFDQNVLGQHK